jgi:signal transduction histidine kinase
MTSGVRLDWPLWRWLLLASAGLIFSGGLFYSYRISHTNSENLIAVEQRAYPLIEQSNLLHLQFRSIQDQFAEAVILGDEAKLLAVERACGQFLETLPRLDGAPPAAVAEIRGVFAGYRDRGLWIGRFLIAAGGNMAEVESEIRDFTERGERLSELIAELNRASRAQLVALLARSRDDSDRMLRSGLITSIAGVMLITSVSGIIFILNRRLREANRTLEQQVQARTQELESFVYTASHDLKSPLVSMQGMASLLVRDFGATLDARARFYVDRIITNANYMEDLIQDLLALSRLGREQGSQRTADVHDVLKEILAIHKSFFEERRVRIVIQPDLPHFVYRQVHLNQLFQNLLTNAAKFMGDQADPVVEVGGRDGRDRIEFYVKDNGIGIDPSYHERIFGIFQRLNDVKVEGTGIGLSIVKKVIDLAQGRIRVESQKGAGTTFFIELPKPQSARPAARLTR